MRVLNKEIQILFQDQKEGRQQFRAIIQKLKSL